MAFVDNTAGGREIREGIMPVKVTIEDTVRAGDLIGYDNITHTAWELADADGKIPAQLIAGQAGVSGDVITAYKMAYIDFGSGSTATPGDVVYLSDTAGQYAATPGGWVNQAVGQCVSATEAFVQTDSSPLCSFTTTGTGFGGFIRTELAALKTSTELWGGLRIDAKVINTAVVSDASGIFGLFVMMQLQDTDCVGQGSVVRLEDTSSSGCACQQFIHFCASGADQPDYIFNLQPNAPTSGCWVNTGTAKTNDGGWLKIYTAGGTRYINMYTG